MRRFRRPPESAVAKLEAERAYLLDRALAAERERDDAAFWRDEYKRMYEGAAAERDAR